MIHEYDPYSATQKSIIIWKLIINGKGKDNYSLKYQTYTLGNFYDKYNFILLYCFQDFFNIQDLEGNHSLKYVYVLLKISGKTYSLEDKAER